MQLRYSPRYLGRVFTSPCKGALRIPAGRMHSRSLASKTRRIPAHASEVDDSFERDIQDSASVIDDVVKQVAQELFLDSAANYVTGQAPTEADLRTVIRAAVEPIVDSLNDTFVPILGQYIEDAQESKNNDIIGVLMGIKREVLALLSERLPPELRILQAALDAPSPAERAQMLRLHAAGEAEPACDAATLLATASRLLDDVEGNEDSVVVDTKLLAKLCLLREELRQIVDEEGMKSSSSTSAAASEHSGNLAESSSRFTMLRGVPQREMIFLKELLAVSSSEKRRALLEAAFKGDTAVGIGAGAGPGALLDSVKALQAEMLGPQYNNGDSENADEGVLLRLEEVWREAILVLEDMSGDASYHP